MKTVEVADDSVVFFPIADLSYFDAKILGSNTEFLDEDDFIIVLGIIYNDIKGLLNYWDFIDEFKPDTPPEGTASAKFGEYMGYRGQIFKYVLSTLNEIIGFFESRESVVNGPTIKKVAAKIDIKQGRDAWTSLCDFCYNSTDDQKILGLRNAIVRARNNAGFHYNQTKEIMKSYRKTFENEKEQPKGYGYFSLGKNLHETRFYFSDAAVAKYLEDLMNKEDYANYSQQFMRDCHVGIRSLIRTYLNHRQTNVRTTGSTFHKHSD